MQDRLRNKLNMYVLVKDFLLASETITAKWAAFAALFAGFAETITEIFSVAAQQQEDKSGVTKTKAQVKASLIENMVTISEKCVAYATVEEKLDFLALTKFMKSDLQRLADADLIKTAESLHKNVLPKFDDVKVYELKQAELTELLELKNQFLTIYTRPAGDIENSAKLTARLDLLFKGADAALEKMDAILQLSRVSAPDFYEEYTRRRTIGKTATRTRALQLWVVDDVTGLPVAKAKVKVRFKSGTELAKVVRSTGGKGGMIVASLDAAEYEYEVSYGGYVTSTGSFFVNDGVMTEVVVRLKK